jgi:cytochrome c-type biogenesis protein CcmH/NrfG
VGFYHGLDDSWSPFDTPFRPLVYARLGAIAEAQGRKAEAIDYYSRLLDLHKDADPIYAAERETILQRRNALLGPR